jgi:hypothetical protein
MAVSSHVFPTLSLNALKHTLMANTDALSVLLINTGTYTWGAGTSETQTHVSEFLAGDGVNGALVEVLTTGGTNYTRQALAGVSLTNSGLVTTLTCSPSPTWPTASFAAKYALFYDNTVGGTDSTNQILGYWDFGASLGVSATSYTLTISGSGLLTWTHS